MRVEVLRSFAPSALPRAARLVSRTPGWRKARYSGLMQMFRVVPALSEAEAAARWPSRRVREDRIIRPHIGLCVLGLLILKSLAGHTARYCWRKVALSPASGF
jgi:hypothetical protein